MTVISSLFRFRRVDGGSLRTNKEEEKRIGKKKRFKTGEWGMFTVVDE